MATAGRQSMLVAPDEGRQLNVVSEILTIKLRGQDTGGAHCVIEEKTPPGGGVPPHVHHREDETFFVLEGEYEFCVGGETIKAAAGSYLFAPRDIPHSLRNAGDTPAKLLVTISPPGFEGFFEEVHEGSQNGPMPLEQMADLGRTYGLEFLG